jgi:hypothetical protein
MLRLYENSNRFYLKQGDGSKEELNKLHIEEHTYVLFI